MKTALIAVIALLLVPSISFAATFNTSLYYGIQDKQDVIALQEFLATQGDFSGQATGNFYSLTLAAVKAFQVQNNIAPVSGYFGILSRGVANQLLAPVAPIEETGTTTQAVVPSPAPVKQPIQVTIVGSTQPVNNTPLPVVQSPVVNSQTPSPTPQAPTPPAWKIDVAESTVEEGTSIQPRFEVNVYDSKGAYAKQTVTVTTDDPDLPSTFTINAPGEDGQPGQVYWFCVAPQYDGFPNQGCKSTNAPTPGTYNFTFTVDDVSVSKQVTI